jgi:outer membrane protein OmpA-like peptidoglycan-associated protein
MDAAPPGITATLLRQQALANIRNHLYDNPLNRPPLSADLGRLAQITVVVDFDFGSARIRPQSYRTVALIADALYSPQLQGYKFLVIGNTDAVGGRAANLTLSQKRADAIRDALINPFGINPARIQAVGLGEEQLLDPAHPTAASNRRVQLINMGK